MRSSPESPARGVTTAFRPPHQRVALDGLHDNARARLLGHNLASLAYIALLAAAVFSWRAGAWPVTVLVWIAAGWLGHAKAIAFHEAAHGLLGTVRSPWRNELQGLLIGTLLFVPLSAYRYVHRSHHARLGSIRDLELWPYVDPTIPRAMRVLAAGAELLAGFLYTPLLMLRGVLLARDLDVGQRRRILLEYLLCVAFWTGVVVTCATWGAWDALVVGYGVPALITGSLQSARKLTEHLGLTGGSVLSSTRTVVDSRPLGRVLSWSLLHNDQHGTHHRYARIPYYHVPLATEYMLREASAAPPTYSSYAAAFAAMCRSLGNPRVGRQWVAPADE